MVKVYLISSNGEGGKKYKIGYTKRDVYKRMKQLSTGNSDRLVLEQVFPSKWGTKIEAILHRSYSNYRIRGEWFDLSKSQVENFLLECLRLENYYKYLENDSTFTNIKNKML